MGGLGSPQPLAPRTNLKDKNLLPSQIGRPPLLATADLTPAPPGCSSLEAKLFLGLSLPLLLATDPLIPRE